jgi:hypothetical protein
VTGDEVLREAARLLRGGYPVDVLVGGLDEESLAALVTACAARRSPTVAGAYNAVRDHRLWSPAQWRCHLCHEADAGVPHPSMQTDPRARGLRCCCGPCAPSGGCPDCPLVTYVRGRAEAAL